MKKTILLLLLGFFLADTHAQRISEGFNTTINPPGWTLLNGSSLLKHEQTINAYSDQFYYPGAVVADNITVFANAEMESPLFTTPTVAGDSIRFDIAAAAMNSQPDSFYVQVFDGINWGILSGWGVSNFPDTGITTASSPSNVFMPASYQWRNKVIALPVGTMKIKFVFMSSLGNRIYLDNVVVDELSTASMNYDSSTVFQHISAIHPGAVNHNIAGIKIHVTGSGSPLTIDDFNFTTGTGNGTITDAKVFYTGNSPYFSTANQYGSTVSAPGTTYVVTGSQPLSQGVNYFWLTYSVPPSVNVNDSFDAACTAITIGGSSSVTPGVTSPDGIIHSGVYYDFEAADDEQFITYDEAGIIPALWGRGQALVAPNTPPAAFSGINVWKTNLNGNYVNETNCVLESPTFVATGSNVEWSFMEALDMNMPFSNASLEYQINNSGWNSLGLPYTYSGQNFWTRRTVNIFTNPGDTINMRWRFLADKGTTGAGWSIDDVVFGNVFELPMIYKGAEAMQLTGRPVGAGLSKQGVLMLPVEVIGTKDPFEINGFTFSTAGSSNITSNVDSARLFYSGDTKDLEKAIQFGSTVVSPNGVFNFTGSQKLAEGYNVFWLVYDISQSAVVGDSIDATCDSIWFAGPLGMVVPSNSSPVGNIKIASSYNFETAGSDNQGFVPVIVNGTLQEWQRGAPSGGLGAPAAPHSGTKCWGTNISGNHSPNVEYALNTPVFLATGDNVSLDFHEFFNVDDMNSQIVVQVQVNNSGWNDVIMPYSGQVKDWRLNQIDVFPTPALNDTVQFRFKFFAARVAPIKAGWYLDDLVFGGLIELTQFHQSSNVSQIPKLAGPGAVNQAVLRIDMYVAGSAAPLVANEFHLDIAGGNVNPQTAKIFYTAGSKEFDTTTQFGTAVISPTGAFIISGNQELVHGLNLFWLTYDIPSTAVYNDSLDAVCSSVVLSSTPYTPGNSDPEGKCSVGLYYDFEAATDEGFISYTVSGEKTNEWSRGSFVPDTYTPAGAFSGSRVWKTNLNGNHTSDADYALQTPVFIATSDNITWTFMEALDFQGCCDFVSLEYKINSGGWFQMEMYNREQQKWWELHELNIPVLTGDTVVFRWRVTSDIFMDGSGLILDDVLFSGVTELSTSYISSTTFQDTTPVAPGFKNQVILGKNVVIAGSNGALTLTQFDLNTSGTTSSLNIDGAKVYYTGSKRSFNSRQLFGSLSAPAGAFTITGSQDLSHGDNYFWLVYDIAPATPVTDLFDAECNSLTINGTPYTPDITAPVEVTPVGTGYDFENPSLQNFTTAIIGGSAADEWEKGAPVGGTGAPASAYSGNNVWGNNLSGNHRTEADYALLSPKFITTNPSQLIFNEFYATPNEFWTSTGMTLEYEINSGGWNPLSLFYKGRITEWTRSSYPIPNTAGDTIQVRWRFSSDFSEPMAGWHIDDVIFTNVAESDLQGPAISFEPLAGDSSTLTRTITDFATITDYSSVDVSIAGAPRVYFKKFSDDNVFGLNDNTGTGWKYVSATNRTSPFSFDIDYSLLFSPVTLGDTIQYFVVAQDSVNPSLQNINAYPLDGFAGTPGFAISSAPFRPLEYYITQGPLSGDYEIGVGRDYTTLTSALADLKLRGAGAAVNFILTDADYNVFTGENMPIEIPEFPGASAVNRLTIKPAAGNTVTIRGDFFAQAVISLTGADYVTIDGSNNGTGSRDLHIDLNDCFSGIWLNSQGPNEGAANNVIKNVNVHAPQPQRRTGIIMGSDNALFDSGEDNNNNTLENNHIYGVDHGMMLFGLPGPGQTNLQITGNAIGSDSAGMEVQVIGIFMRGISKAEIAYNNVYNILGIGGRGGNWTTGIELADGVTNVAIHHNTVRKIESLSARGMSAKGIYLSSGTGTGNISITNNMITEVVSDGSFVPFHDEQPVGITIIGGSNYQVYHNTVHMTGLRPDNGAGSIGACLWIDRNASGLDVRNNIFSMDQDCINSAVGLSYSIVSNVGSSAYTALDNNLYFDSTLTGAFITTYIGKIGGVNYTDLASWKAATGKDANSSSKRVFFVSNQDAHLTGSSIGDLSLSGASLPAVATDIDGQARNFIPYMGADEITGSPLPVKLVQFAGKLSGYDAVLTWKTAGETNNHGFDVEVSQDGKTFERIGFVKGAGSVSTGRSYTFTHFKAFANGSSRNYYRLRQVDRSGNFEYSSVVSVNKLHDRSAAMVAYPNPFTDQVTMEFTNTVSEQVTVEVYDLFGKKIYAATHASVEGNNKINIDQSGTVNAGIYQIRIVTSDDVKFFKVIRE